MLHGTGRAIRTVIFPLVLLVLLSPCSPAQTQTAENFITAEEADKLLTGKSPPLLLDVRTEAEFESGHLRNARRIIVDEFVLGEYEKKLGKLLGKLANDAPVIVYCRSGRRSGIAQGVLVEDGYSNIRNLEGGILAWGEAGLPIVKEAGKKQGRESGEQAGGC